ncbi:hypothetical protein [Staphylospora marina]|uniref:hypothetical protein n=1 Tax=Staphylospora marina TaxID=2490858 RepID=UPI000F5BBD61|nr:hypothetical protein [Staphylospora marina]
MKQREKVKRDERRVIRFEFDENSNVIKGFSNSWTFIHSLNEVGGKAQWMGNGWKFEYPMSARVR